MKKLLAALTIIFLSIIISTPSAFAEYNDVKINYQKIKSIKTRVNTIIKNKRGSVVHRGQYTRKGIDKKRYDEISPSRCVFLLDGDEYRYYNLTDRQTYKQKIKDLSDAHRIFIEQIFLPEVFDPISYLEKKYNIKKTADDSAMEGKSKTNKNANIKILIKNNRISIIRFFVEKKLTKTISYSNYKTINGTEFPHIVKTSIPAGGMEITTSLKRTEINQDINDDIFKKIISD